MYVHSHQLEHLLEPRHYTDPVFFRREMEAVFRPSWQLAGSIAEMPKEGDFRTFTLLGRPVIMRNLGGGRLQAYENVCAHRHCMLTDAERGRMPKLRCQYHGWEYDEHGNTGKIPDAKCFRPWDRENSHLRLFPTRTVGELIFVSLNEDPPELEDYLGDYHGLFTDSFGGEFRLCWSYTFRFKANWKIPCENTLEMYHLPCLHTKTLRAYGKEEDYEHVLGEGWSTLHTREYIPWVTALQNWVLRRVGREPTGNYTHHFAHPNFVYIGTDVVRIAETFHPVSVDETEQRVWAYSVRGSRRNPLALYSGWLMSKFARTVTRRIMNEDLPIFEDVQRGVSASRHTGVIGSLEERIYTLQKYVLEPTSVPVTSRSYPLPPRRL